MIKKSEVRTLVDGYEAMWTIREGEHGNEFFIEEFLAPMLNTDEMDEFCVHWETTQDEIISFCEGFEIW